jgi:NAD(P)-dependent dehydrogenase (short-subunit alcohol dehydrogenase family)
MHSAKDVLIVGATGGLGKALVIEALLRGMEVSVLVRSEQKLNEELGDVVVNRLSAVHIGDAANQSCSAFYAGKEVVFVAVGANASIAKAVSKACKENNVKKVCFPFFFLNEVISNFYFAPVDCGSGGSNECDGRRRCDACMDRLAESMARGRKGL